MRRFGIFKHEYTLVLRFLVYPDDKWENHVDVLKNSEKIHSMHLCSLYGNLKIFEEKVVLRKVIRKDSFKEKSSTLLTEKRWWKVSQLWRNLSFCSWLQNQEEQSKWWILWRKVQVFGSLSKKTKSWVKVSCRWRRRVGWCWRIIRWRG